MLEIIRGGALILATITVGIMAGVFQLYSYAIMPGLGKTDDRTFVGAFQQIDRSIVNPLFLSIFLGAFGFTGLAALLHLGADVRPVLIWIAFALILYAVAFFITVRVHVPLNDALKAAGDPDQITDLAALRERFEDTWVRWNLVRAVLSTIAFICLAWSLIQYGRAVP